MDRILEFMCFFIKALGLWVVLVLLAMLAVAVMKGVINYIKSEVIK